MRINQFYPYSSIRQLNETSASISRSLTRLASGQRLNRPSDNPADFARAANIETASRGIAQQIRGLNDARSLFATASVGLESQMNILQKMRELSVQAANGALSTGDRKKLNEELQSLMQQLDRVADQTSFNGLEMLNGNTPSLKLADRIVDFSDVRGVGLFRKDSVTPDSAASFEFLTDNQASGANAIGAVLLEDNGNGTRGSVIVFDDGSYKTSDGEMNLIASGTLALSSAGGSFVANDIDQDGDTDLIYNDISTGTIEIYTNHHGEFTQIFSKEAFQDIDLAFGDFDGNGETDIAFADNATISTISQSGGFFDTPTAVLNIGSTVTAIQTVNFGSYEAHLAVATGTTLKIFKSTAGSFGQSFSQSTALKITGILADGIDLYLESNGEGQIQKYQINDLENLEAANGLLFDQTNGVETLIWDVDLDGFKDLVAITGAGTPSGLLEVFLGSASGIATTSSLSTLFDYYDGKGSWGDLNGDDILDYLSFENDNIGTNFGTYTAAASGAVNANALTAYGDLSLLTTELAEDTMAYTDSAIERLKEVQSQYAIEMTRIEIQQTGAETQVSILSQSRNQILNADIAEEISELTRLQILQQAQNAAFAQSTLAMRLVLELLDIR